MLGCLHGWRACHRPTLCCEVVMVGHGGYMPQVPWRGTLALDNLGMAPWSLCIVGHWQLVTTHSDVEVKICCHVMPFSCYQDMISQIQGLFCMGVNLRYRHQLDKKTVHSSKEATKIIIHVNYSIKEKGLKLEVHFIREHLQHSFLNPLPKLIFIRRAILIKIVLYISPPFINFSISCSAFWRVSPAHYLQ